jgi:hypothetical protein
MKVALCLRCGRSWSVLRDGTLVEHPQADSRDFLCSGSRTKPASQDLDRIDPTTTTVPMHVKPVPSAN